MRPPPPGTEEGRERGPHRAKAPEAGRGGSGGGWSEMGESTGHEHHPQRKEAQYAAEPSSER